MLNFRLPGYLAACLVALVSDATTPGGAWPDSITATVGDVQVRFEKRSFWTLYRMDYHGERLGIDRWGSHYGSVAKLPNIGFIGSGHTENEDEIVQSLQLVVDGNPLPNPPDSLTCSQLLLKKTTRIRTLILESEVAIANNRIFEQVTLTAETETAVDLIYHFMHPWTTDMDRYLALLSDTRTVRGRFNGDKGFKIDQPALWTAVYDPVRAMGVVTCVLEAPEANWTTRYWDVSDRYRKHYFTTFQNATVPAATPFTYRIVTVPFSAHEDAWESQARALGAQHEKELHRSANSD